MKLLACCALLTALELPLLATQSNAYGEHAAVAGTPTTYNAASGVAYARGLHGDLLADLYLPNTRGPHAAILFLHGGGWRGGDRRQLKSLASQLAEAGYAGVAIDYDLSTTGARFPTALMESKAALRWMRAHAAQYGIDPDHIAVVGSSAGGELAAELGLTADQKKYETGNDLRQSSAVQAVAVFNGVLDLSDLGEHADMVEDYLAGSCAQKMEACHEASPVFNVHVGAPPFFVGHGTSDPVVPFRQAQLLVQRLRESHVPVTPFIAKNGGHTYWANTRWFQPNLEALKQFLAGALK